MSSIGVYNFNSDISYPVDDAGLHHGTEWDGLFARWKCNDVSGNIADDAGIGNFYGTPTGVSYGNAGKIDTSLWFNGSSSRVELLQDGPGIYIREMTFCAWVKIDAVADPRYIFSYYNSSQSYGGIFFEGTVSTITKVRVKQSTSTGTVTLDGPISFGVWFHLAVSLSYSTGVGVVSVYINGNKQISTYTFGAGIQYHYNDSGKMAIGCRVQSATVFSNFFNGWLEDVRLYRGNLSDSTVAAIYNGGFGTYSRPSYFNTRVLSPYAKGFFGDSTKPPFYIASHADFDGDKDFTIELTYTPTETALSYNNHILARRLSSSSAISYYIYVTGSPLKFAAAISDGTTTISVVDTTAIVAGRVYDLAVTWDVSEKTLKLYVNGILVDEDTDLAIVPASIVYNCPIFVGSNLNGSLLTKGTFHRLRISNVVKTVAEINSAINGFHFIEDPWA